MVDAILSYAIERLGDLLIEEAKFLYSVNDKVEHLKRELRLMQCLLQDADAKQHKTNSSREVIAEIRDIAFDAEDTIDVYALEVASRKGSSAKEIISRSVRIVGELAITHKVGSKIDHLVSRISDLKTGFQAGTIKEIARMELDDGGLRRSRQLNRVFTHILDRNVVGLEKSINSLMEFLRKGDPVQKQRFNVISICGMPGIWKTTLAKKIYHHHEIRDHFKASAWVYVSQQCRTGEVWKDVLRKLTTPNKEEADEVSRMKEDEVAKKLYNFMKENRCLVILDDIWKISDWDDLSPAFPIGETDGKIVITTRFENILQRADKNGYLHRCQCLEEEDSWTLFEKIVIAEWDDTEFEVTDSMKELGRKMLKHCGGLPLAITVLGGLLQTKHTIDDWDSVHANVKTYLRRGEGNEEELLGVEKVLALSYDDLPYRLKSCFSHLGHFPEDFEIPTRKLFQMWVAEGFISSQSHGDEETKEQVAKRYLDELVHRCIVQVGTWGLTGKIKTCRLHDVLRDFCITKVREENVLKVVNLGRVHESTSGEASSSSSFEEISARIR